MTPSYEQASAYIAALTGEDPATAALWWRCIHDADKTIPAHKYYGTLSAVWETLCGYNQAGWGIFANINAFNPPAPDRALHENKHNLADVWYIRTQAVDLDNTLTANQNYQLAAASNPPPTFAVATSDNKFHLYYTVQPYVGNDYYSLIQQKLRQLYDGDRAIIDPTRVLRVPGFFNHKYAHPQSDKHVPGAQPYLVTCWTLGGFGQRYNVAQIEAALQHVNVIDVQHGRKPLGDAELAAPSLDWLRFSMSLVNPNEMDRREWLSISAAFKQAGWNHADEPTLRSIWDEWCARYSGNDAAENDKLWNSVRDSETGWKSFYRHAPTLIAYEKFGFDKREAPQPLPPETDQPSEQPTPDAPDAPQQSFPEILSDIECRQFFKDCYFIEREGRMLTPRGRFMNATQFNGAYGGHLFVIDANGKTTDEPWKAATRSTLWTVPKIDHVRFLPQEPQFKIVSDQLGRKGINTYIPVRIRSKPGDITPWLRHMELMLPVESDRQQLFRYMAHNVKFPGFKIPWAPLIQSAEGVGKGFIIKAIERIIGDMYVYRPKAEELVKSGSTFNAWQRGKLMIIVDEIKVDEKRDLIEILKPLITEDRAEIQSKGVDQDMEDNPANWWFFSNYKDAIPVSQNGRRYSVYYSVIQNKADLLARGMNDDYFIGLFTWLENGGSEIIAHWLLNYPIERGDIPRTAPETSSQAEAIRVSRGPIEKAILNAIEDQLPGFRGGYVSTLAVLSRLKSLGGRQPSQSTVERILEGMGYSEIGRAKRMYSQENMSERSLIFAVLPDMPIDAYGRLQGYAE